MGILGWIAVVVGVLVVGFIIDKLIEKLWDKHDGYTVDDWRRDVVDKIKYK